MASDEEVDFVSEEIERSDSEKNTKKRKRESEADENVNNDTDNDDAENVEQANITQDKNLIEIDSSRDLFKLRARFCGPLVRYTRKTKRRYAYREYICSFLALMPTDQVETGLLFLMNRVARGDYQPSDTTDLKVMLVLFRFFPIKLLPETRDFVHDMQAFVKKIGLEDRFFVLPIPEPTEKDSAVWKLWPYYTFIASGNVLYKYSRGFTTTASSGMEKAKLMERVNHYRPGPEKQRGVYLVASNTADRSDVAAVAKESNDVEMDDGRPELRGVVRNNDDNNANNDAEKEEEDEEEEEEEELEFYEPPAKRAKKMLQELHQSVADLSQRRDGCVDGRNGSC